MRNLRIQLKRSRPAFCEMPYIPLDIHSGHNQVDELIRKIIEPLLNEAHWLLAATRPSDGPDGHFPRASAIVLVSTISAVSALGSFKKPGQKQTSDHKRFVSCVRDYFPWEHIEIKDDQYRSLQAMREAASEGLYGTFRCPLIHAAGLVHNSLPLPAINKIHPGHNDIGRAEARLEKLVKLKSLNGEVVIKFEATRFEVYVDCLYWCVRSLTERFAADPKNAKEIIAHAT